MRFSVKTTPQKSDQNKPSMESLVLQMIALCIEQNPQFENKILESIEKVKNAA